MTYKPNTEVRLSVIGKSKYPDCGNNPHSETGWIGSEETSGWNSVDWQNGGWNEYKVEDLELVK